MVDIIQLSKDMKSGYSIDEILKKHQITLSTAIKLLKNHQRKHKKRPPVKYEVTNEKYIKKVNGRIYIRKYVNGNVRSFGGYDCMEDAIKIRDYLEKNGWSRQNLDMAKQDCGVR